MGVTVLERIEKLEASAATIAPEDTITESGRKILLAEFTKMLKHEAGSRTGEDVEDVHDMRVATRRMRSLFRLLKPFFKSKDIRPFSRELREIAWALGDVRDLDVMIDDLREYQQGQEEAAQTELAEIIALLDRRRAEARGVLVSIFDSKTYRRFLKGYSTFVTTPGKAWKSDDGAVVPHQTRHVLPGLIHERLAAVRAYESVLEDVDDVTLHALRIEFKRLRYTLSLFESVLGSQIDDFIDEIRAVQDALGHLNDVHAARSLLDTTLEGDELPEAALVYFNHLEARAAAHRAQFAEAWERFNTRKVQQKLSNAILALR